MNRFRLDGEVALITGGGTGIGLAIARCMAEAGAQVVIAGRTESTLRQACESIGPACTSECYDVTQFEKAPALVERIRKRLGKISILVNDAGVHLKKPAIETSEAETARILETHLLGGLALTRACAPGMIQARSGAILFMGSMSSLLGIPMVIAYTAAKTACVGAVRALASELSPHNVRVNAILPGWIETEMLHRALDSDPKRRQRILDRTLMQRFGSPEDIGHAAVYLCSPAAGFVTGTALAVDGGASIGL
jgi:gluconate 5-dehydrogenase